jgi:hypothetical protein
MSYLKNIVRMQATNLGSIIDLRVVRKDDVLSIPEAVDGAIYGDIQLKPGKSWVQWRFIHESPKMESIAKTSRDGSARDNRLGFLVPKDRQELQAMFEAASLDEFIVLFRYPNTDWKVFGLLEAPVRFEYDHTSGGALADRNQYSARFYYQGPDNRFFYLATVPAPPAGPAPSLVKLKAFNQDDSEAVVLASLASGETLMIISDFSPEDFYVIQ